MRCARGDVIDHRRLVRVFSESNLMLENDSSYFTCAKRSEVVRRELQDAPRDRHGVSDKMDPLPDYSHLQLTLSPSTLAGSNLSLAELRGPIRTEGRMS